MKTINEILLNNITLTINIIMLVGAIFPLHIFTNLEFSDSGEHCMHVIPCHCHHFVDDDAFEVIIFIKNPL